eukprot:2970317-Rhodomonas_salina.2
MDDNMFHISFESGILEDPAATAPVPYTILSAYHKLRYLLPYQPITNSAASYAYTIHICLCESTLPAYAKRYGFLRCLLRMPTRNATTSSATLSVKPYLLLLRYIILGYRLDYSPTRTVRAVRY